MFGVYQIVEQGRLVLECTRLLPLGTSKTYKRRGD